MATTETGPLLTLTENAARKVQDFAAQEPAGEAEVLRIAIQGGGCSGFQYALGFDRGPQDGDHEIEMHGVRVVVDPFSAPYLKGAEIDFADGLTGAGFAIDNPNVVQQGQLKQFEGTFDLDDGRQLTATMAGVRHPSRPMNADGLRDFIGL